MSVKVMGWVWEIRDLSSSEKLVLLAYADHAHHDGTSIFPSIETMVKKTGLSRRSIQRVSQSLIEKGFLINEGQHDSGTNLYRIPVPEYEGGDMVTPPREKGVSESQEGVSESTETGVTVTPEPLLTIHKPDIEKINLNGGIVSYVAELCNLDVEKFCADVGVSNSIKQIAGRFGDEDFCNIIYKIKLSMPEIGWGALVERAHNYGDSYR